MELAHLPYKKATYEDYVGERALKRFGKKKWRKKVAKVIDALDRRPRARRHRHRRRERKETRPTSTVVSRGRQRERVRRRFSSLGANERTSGVSSSSCHPERSEARTVQRSRRTPAWAALGDHYDAIRNVHLRDLFADDPKRGERLNAEAAGIYLDYSKNRVTDETIKLLLHLAEQSGLRERIDAMFRGEKINVIGEPRGAARRAARAEGRVDRRRRRERRAGRARRARQDERLRRPRSQRRLDRVTPASASATSSTSASAAPISVR